MIMIKIDLKSVIKGLAVALFLLVLSLSVIARMKENAANRLESEQLLAERNEFKKERDLLADSLRILREEKKNLLAVNQHREAEYKGLAQRLLRVQHDFNRIIDSLQNIPEDLAYCELHHIYPTSEPLRFPFSGDQVKNIFTDITTLPLVEYQLGLQSEMLKKCNQVTSGKADIIANLEQQTKLLTENGRVADSQIALLQHQVIISNKTSREKGFWNKVYKGIITGETIYIFIDALTK